MSLLMVGLGMLAGCSSCRGLPPDLDATHELGTVWQSGTIGVRLPIAGLTADSDDIVVTAGEGYTDVRWSPSSAGPQSVTLSSDAGAHDLTAEVVAPSPVWPSPLAVDIAAEPLASQAQTGFGDAAFPADGPIPIVSDGPTGEVWLGAADQGRAWRLDVFYNHATQGLWVREDFNDSGSWQTPPACFTDTLGLLQDGTCDGTEQDTNGSVPGGWHFLHGGFVGASDAAPEEALPGLSAMVSDEDQRRVWLLGSDADGGWLRAIDTSLGPDDGEDADNPYSYRQLADGIDEALGAAWTGLSAGLYGDGLWIASADTGTIGTLAAPGGAPVTLAALETPLQAVTQLDTMLVAVTATSIVGVSLEDGGTLFETARPAGLPDGAPVDTAAGEGVAWLVWPEVMVKVSPLGAATMLLPPEGVSLVGLEQDTVSGGTATPLSVLYAAGVSDDGSGVLWGASPGGTWYGEPLPLPATPRALGYAADPHDLYVLYDAGSEGCDDPALSDTCTGGVRPPVVHALYNPYGLVPPTSTGHLMNLFLSPIVETPKDSGVGIDFSQGRCADPAPYASEDCCALAWSVQERLQSNVDYFEGTLQPLGATLVWGINPTLLQQAWRCLERPDKNDQAAGAMTYELLLSMLHEGSDISAWTHTPAGDGMISDSQNWFVLQSPALGDYQPPVSDQIEYQYLHDGMAAVFDPTRLPEAAGALRSEAADAMWTPLVSGNALDASDLVTYSGWAAPDWLTPARDAPLSLSQPPREAYYFLSAGAELEIGTTKFRKKELYPLDVRDRVASWLSTDPDAPGVPDPSSGVVNLPGISWEIGTLSGVSEAGSFRETLRFPVSVDTDDWTYIHRYIRRLIASTEPDDVKTWYLHIFDVSNPNGLFTANSQVTDTRDINADAIEQINADFVAPGYARWALPDDILEEWDGR